MTGVQADGYYAIIPEWVLDAEISDRAVRLYGVLRRYADHRTLQATPSRRTLADRLRVADVKAVGRALSDLQRIGAVTVTHRTTEAGDRDSNAYLLHVSPWGGGSSAPTPAPDTHDDLPASEGGRGSSAPTVGAGMDGVGVPAPPRVGAPAPHQEPQPLEPQPTPLPLPLPPAPIQRAEPLDDEGGAEEKPTKRKRPQQIPDDWQPSERAVTWADEKHPDWEKRETVEEFRNYWQGRGVARADWDATWRSRVAERARTLGNGSGRYPARSAPRPGSLSAPLPPRDSYTYGDGKF